MGGVCLTTIRTVEPGSGEPAGGICCFLYACFDHVGLIFKNRKLVLGADACCEISAWGGYADKQDIKTT